MSKTISNAVAEGVRDKPNLEMLRSVWTAAQDQIRFADSKAGFVAAFHALLFGFMMTQADKLTKVAVANRQLAFWVAVITVTIYGLLTAIAVVMVILSVMSRFGDLAPQSKSFFGHITKQYGKDYGKYHKDACAMQEHDWCEDIAGQIVEVSHIAGCKHRLVRRAALCTLCAFVFWCITLVTMLWLG